MLVEAIEGEDLVEAQRAVETGVHLAGAPEATTGQAHVPTAAGVPPVWDLEVVVVAVVVAAGGGGRHGRRT